MEHKELTTNEIEEAVATLSKFQASDPAVASAVEVAISALKEIMQAKASFLPYTKETGEANDEYVIPASVKYSKEPAASIKFLATHGISERTALWLFKHNNIWESDNGNCCFPIKDVYGTDIADEIWDIKTAAQTKLGKADGYGYSVCVGKVNDSSPIYFFKNAIELLQKLEKSSAEWKELGFSVRLVSMSGLDAAVIANYIKCFPLAELTLFLANGEEENAFAKIVGKMFVRGGVCRCQRIEL